MNNVIGYFVTAVIPLSLYGLAGLYLKRVAKQRFESALYVLGLALGGIGALLLIVSAVIPHGLPSAVAYLLLAIPILLASLVFVIRMGMKVFASDALGRGRRSACPRD